MLRREFMLPNADDGPTMSSEEAILKAVALLVFLDLGFPPLMPGCRGSPPRHLSVFIRAI